MNITSIVDVLILLIVGIWGIYGFKRGFIKQGVMTIGTILMFAIAFYLKNPIAEFLSLHLPFFRFGGMLGADVFNVLMYQLIAFIIVVSLLEIVLNLLIKLSGIIELLLKVTIIFGIPSKILGLILGVVEGFVIVYIALFFLSQPAFDLNLLDDSKITPIVLQKIPGLSNIASGMVETFDDLSDLTKQYGNSKDNDAYERDAFTILLKHRVISVDYVEKLIERNKISVSGLDTILNQYR